MANEIYDSTWWGNTIDTASSIGTSTEMIQGQFNLTKLGDEEVTNGNFATDSDWTKGNGWSIENGKANADTIGNFLNLWQSNVFTVGKKYSYSFTITDYTQGSVRFTQSGYDISGLKNDIGIYTGTFISTNTALYIQGKDSFIGSIDNVSVKEARATTVEASKCLADTIHRIGLQDIQN